MSASKHISIDNTEDGTIYDIWMKGKFRIVQTADETFIIQKWCKIVKYSFGFFKDKKTILFDWKNVDKDGKKLYIDFGVTNAGEFKTYKRKDGAIKWINDFAKYPIYH